MASSANTTKPKPWTEMATHLVDVATGRKPADLVIRNGRWVNVHSGEIIAGTDIAIAGGRFAYCGPNAGHAIGQGTKVVDAGGRYLVPGLCDGAHACRKRHGDGDRILPRRHPARHHLDVHRSA